jgi:hypothetical protein
MNLTRALFHAARLSATASAVASGHPRRIARRAKNIVVGRALAKGWLLAPAVALGEPGRCWAPATSSSLKKPRASRASAYSCSPSRVKCGP